MKRLWIAACLIGFALPLAACPKAQEAEDSHAAGEHAPGESHDEASGTGHAEREGEHAEGEADEHGHEEGHEEGIVRLDTAAQKEIGLKTAPAGIRPLKSELVTSGTITANANREAHVTTRVGGRVTAIYKNVGDRVAAGEPLAMLDSIELGEAQSSYLEALARLELAQATYTRQSQLFRSELIAQKEVLAARNELRLAEIEVEKAKSQLKLYGFTSDRTAALARRRTLAPTVPLLAPIAGVVLERHLTLGEALEPSGDEPAFTLTDVSELWVNANLYERDLSVVKEGMAAVVTTPAYPGKTYRGRVSLISTGLDPATRTAKARVVVANPDRRLRPDMTATVRLAVGSRTALAVPTAAIATDKGEKFVFVRQGPEEFKKTTVAVGEGVDGWVPVTQGLSKGQEIVTQGTFKLKSELLKESFGEHSH